MLWVQKKGVVLLKLRLVEKMVSVSSLVYLEGFIAFG